MPTTALQPFHRDALASGIIALASDVNAPERRGGDLVLAVAPHDHHVVALQPADRVSWTPLLSRAEALAALPGREASADEVLTALEALVARLSPLGRCMDVGAHGVFVDAAPNDACAATPGPVAVPFSPDPLGDGTTGAGGAG